MLPASSQICFSLSYLTRTNVSFCLPCFFLSPTWYIFVNLTFRVSTFNTLLLYSLSPHRLTDWQRNDITRFAWAGGTCPRFAWAEVPCISTLKKNPAKIFVFSGPANFLHQPATRSITTGKKKRYRREIFITSGKKKSSSRLSGGYAINYDRKKKDTYLS